jgi:small multidrug resistance family-3 protein
VKSLMLFIAAGLCEIGGGYLLFRWWNEDLSFGRFFGGALLLVAYGIIAANQPAHFGRVYAAYGGIFVFMSLLWSWGIDQIRPDRWDIIGAALCIVGTIIIFYPKR